jgi:hypothetical protein
MNELRTGTPLICPDCGAKVSVNAPRCWMCGRPLSWATPAEVRIRLATQAHADTSSTVRTFAGHQAGDDYHRRAPFQFGLASIMLIITLAAVVLGVYKMAPGIGIALAIVAITALIPTCIISRRKGAQDEPLSSAEQISYFVAWLGLALIVLIAAGFAFFVTCFVGAITTIPSALNPNVGSDFTAVLVFSSIVALVVAFFVSRYFLRKFHE